MNAHAQTQRERGQLRKLVALLLALAGLAERAAGRSAPVRHLVVWFLQRGEAAASDHLFALTGNLAGDHSSPALVHTDAEGALRLAARFCVLAAALAAYADSLVTEARVDLRRTAHALLAAVSAPVALAGPVAPVEFLDSS